MKSCDFQSDGGAGVEEGVLNVTKNKTRQKVLNCLQELKDSEEMASLSAESGVSDGFLFCNAFPMVFWSRLSVSKSLLFILFF